MGRQAWSRSWWWRGAVLAATLPVLAVAFCLFDTDGDGVNDPGFGIHLCNVPCSVPLVLATVIVCLGRPMLAGWWRDEVIPSFSTVVLPPLDPPPEFVSLS